MDEQLKSRFEKVLEHYAGIIKQRDDALIREKTARDQFEASFRTVVDRVILPAAAQVNELLAPKNWICRATKADNGLSAKIEIYQGNMKAATGERPHVKISAAAKVSDVQIYVASQSSGSSQKNVLVVGYDTPLSFKQWAGAAKRFRSCSVRSGPQTITLGVLFVAETVALARRPKTIAESSRERVKLGNRPPDPHRGGPNIPRLASSVAH
jgi:hypothetical protein